MLMFALSTGLCRLVMGEVDVCAFVNESFVAASMADGGETCMSMV